MSLLSSRREVRPDWRAQQNYGKLLSHQRLQTNLSRSGLLEQLAERTRDR